MKRMTMIIMRVLEKVSRTVIRCVRQAILETLQVSGENVRLHRLQHPLVNLIAILTSISGWPIIGRKLVPLVVPVIPLAKQVAEIT